MSLLLLLTEAAVGSIVADHVAVTQRVLINTTDTVDLQLTQDGDPHDADQPPTVQITRDDGTVLIPAGTTSTRFAPGHYTYPLAAAQTSQLDWLTVTWTAVVDGLEQQATTRVEIVGGFLFGLGDLRNDRDLTDATKYPTSTLADARTLAEQEIEQACGVAFVPRYNRAPYTLGDGRLLIGPGLRALRTISRGTATVAPDTVPWDPVGWIDLTGAALPAPAGGSGAVQVAYEHGYDAPPAAVSQAALTIAKDYLVRGPMDDRAIQRATEDGPIFIATPGWRGNRFGIPSVDAVIDTYRIPAIG